MQKVEESFPFPTLTRKGVSFGRRLLFQFVFVIAVPLIITPLILFVSVAPRILVKLPAALLHTLLVQSARVRRPLYIAAVPGLLPAVAPEVVYLLLEVFFNFVSVLLVGRLVVLDVVNLNNWASQHEIANINAYSHSDRAFVSQLTFGAMIIREDLQKECRQYLTRMLYDRKRKCRSFTNRKYDGIVSSSMGSYILYGMGPPKESIRTVHVAPVFGLFSRLQGQSAHDWRKPNPQLERIIGAKRDVMNPEGKDRVIPNSTDIDSWLMRIFPSKAHWLMSISPLTFEMSVGFICGLAGY